MILSAGKIVLGRPVKLRFLHMLSSLSPSKSNPEVLLLFELYSARKYIVFQLLRIECLLNAVKDALHLLRRVNVALSSLLGMKEFASNNSDL